LHARLRAGGGLVVEQAPALRQLQRLGDDALGIEASAPIRQDGP
jgi:hypothetical protein